MSLIFFLSSLSLFLYVNVDGRDGIVYDKMEYNGGYWRDFNRLVFGA